MGRLRRLTVALLVTFLETSNPSRLEREGEGSPCYFSDNDGIPDPTRPQKCMPPFENIMAGKPVDVSPVNMTCGLKSMADYCIQTHGAKRPCAICDANDPEKSHNPEYLTDVDTETRKTWWQSVTMMGGVDKQNVNLTVNLGTAYEITYVRLKFKSPRPFSFAIYKKNRLRPAEIDEDLDTGWIPWQYYSATCRDAYKMPDSRYIIQPGDGKTKINEDRSLCTSDFSDLTPLTGANVAYSTLAGRESALNFEYSPELQEWVTATDIRISLQRLNTFGDELFGDPKVLSSYYYAITDFTVGGRCKCNGHATHCDPVKKASTENATTTMVCLCQHGTDGPNCETCLPDHWDVPWRRATSQTANECRACECNGWSSRCQFNEGYYVETGRGGECLDCEGNRGGQHCEKCLKHHYFSPTADDQGRIPCEPCDCNPVGASHLQCSEQGRCYCKPGVEGSKCDRCAPNHWNFGDLGCQTCGCLAEGSLNNAPSCDPTNGNCFCKQNVEGQRCDRCKAGHFYIDDSNEFGCTPCFCHGHTSECQLSRGYGKVLIRSDFSRSDEGWEGYENEVQVPLRYDGINKLVGIQAINSPSSPNGAYFSAPANFLGDQRASYNQNLKFKFRANKVGGRPGPNDIVLASGGAKASEISLSVADQGNREPSMEVQDYTFRLHENPEFGWRPRLSSKDFMAVLANVTAIRIRGTYGHESLGFLDEVKLESAARGATGPQATSIERCDCPRGYKGQFCELCVPGYYHENNGGPFARCIPCSCNDHSNQCDPESGKCECRHNTDGHSCEKCAKGFYGNALAGTPNDCAPCPCPEGGACIEVPGNAESPICTECPEGRTGPRCELCMDGYFGDPEGRFGRVRPCRKCECNGNVDENAIGNCDSSTGECLRCIGNTDGFNCERCKPSFFGDALALKKLGDPPSCQPCRCHRVGTNNNDETFLSICNGFTGDCSCKPHVEGRNCDRCVEGYFNLDSGDGCEPCNCDSVGSLNATCQVHYGQCFCNEGVTGQRCSECQPRHYDFTPNGCKPCECDPTGSSDLQCNLVTGQCPCWKKVEGRRCDRCMENTKSRDAVGSNDKKVCEPCDDCYTLVGEAVDRHRNNLDTLDRLLQQIADNPEPVGLDFEFKLRELKNEVTGALVDAKISSKNDEGGTLRDRLEDLRGQLQDLIQLVTSSGRKIEVAEQHGAEAEEHVKRAREVIEQARQSMKDARKVLDVRGRDALKKAKERAKKFGKESEKMSAIARQARNLAERQVEDANEISSIAEQAVNTATTAYEMTSAALEQQLATGQQIRILQKHVVDMGKKLGQVQSLAGRTLKDSTDAYHQALHIYQQAIGLEVPVIRSKDMKAQAKKIEAEATRLRNEAQQLDADNEQLLSEAQDRRVQLEDLLRRAETQQRQVDAQLADVDRNRVKALDAVAAGNMVLQDAAKTLRTLEDFENSVNANKVTAQAALETIDEIDGIVRDAYGKVAEAREAMDGAGTAAELAFSVAEDALEISSEASLAAANISQEAAENSDLADELSSATESLAVKIQSTKEILEEKEAVATSDGDAAITALEKANQAQNKAKESAIKVKEAKEELDEIVGILSTVQEPEPGLLEELARRVEEAEGKFQAADLDIRLQELEAAKQRQAEQIRDMMREMEYMMEESHNIQGIKNSLPVFCPKSNELCLEDQC